MHGCICIASFFPLLCAKPVGEAGGTEVLATAASEVSITKDLGTDGADVLAGNSVHKVIVIATILLVPAEDTFIK